MILPLSSSIKMFTDLSVVNNCPTENFAISGTLFKMIYYLSLTVNYIIPCRCLNCKSFKSLIYNVFLPKYPCYFVIPFISDMCKIFIDLAVAEFFKNTLIMFNYFSKYTPCLLFTSINKNLDTLLNIILNNNIDFFH